MRKGKIINGYMILMDFTTAGGGLSKWSFARKNGREYFIKEFLHPTFPEIDGFGSESVKRRKREECEVFEQHHTQLMEAIGSSSIPMANLVIAKDFFRHGSKYYKVTDKIGFNGIGVRDVHTLNIEDLFLVMTTLTKSLNFLHKLNIVHGDIKPENVLIKKTVLNSHITKLIDFDNSYFEGAPPTAREELVGDMVYYSPEMARYIMGDTGLRPDELTDRSDMFALGLLFARYINGHLPEFEKEKYKYACLYILRGNQIRFESSRVDTELQALINAMLSQNYRDRPDSAYVFNYLSKFISPPKESMVDGIEKLLHDRKTKPVLFTAKTNKDSEDPEGGLRGSLVDH